MTFKKGQSGNPKGRSKELLDLIETAKKYGPEALEKIASLMKSSDQKIRLEACKYLIDRGYGRPSQAVEVTGQLDTSFHITFPLLNNPSDKRG